MTVRQAATKLGITCTMVRVVCNRYPWFGEKINGEWVIDSRAVRRYGRGRKPNGPATRTGTRPEEVAKLLAKRGGDLTVGERFVLRKRYGLTGTAKQSLERIGRLLEISPQAVWGIEDRALRKLGLLKGRKGK